MLHQKNRGDIYGNTRKGCPSFLSAEGKGCVAAPALPLTPPLFLLIANSVGRTVGPMRLRRNNGPVSGEGEKAMAVDDISNINSVRTTVLQGQTRTTVPVATSPLSIVSSSVAVAEMVRPWPILSRSSRPWSSSIANTLPRKTRSSFLPRAPIFPKRKTRPAGGVLGV